MRNPTTRWQRPLLMLALILALLNCHPESRRKVLTTLFDGVPPPAITEPSPDSLATGVENAGKPEAASGEGLRAMQHSPYEEKYCKDCHDLQMGNALVMPQPELCYECHDDDREKCAHLHGPVGGGYCTTCHNPHRAENPHLLRMTPEELCFYCHQQEDVYRNDTHEDVLAGECLDCHNPHGGEDWDLSN